MSLYSLYLKGMVALKRAGIALHLTHPPTMVSVPTSISWPLKGICADWHGGISDAPTNVVIRAAVENPAQLQVVLNFGPKVIALVETCDLTLVEQLGSFIAMNPPGIECLIGIELGNEIDLTPTSSKEFGQFVGNAYTALVAAKFNGDVISGGVSRVRPDTLAWLKEALSWVSPSVMVGIHRYSIDNDATIPQDGYVNRNEECNAIIEVANGRRTAITEFGYPLLDGYSEPDYRKVRSSIQTDLSYFARMGAKYAIYYQWLCGPSNTPIDRFGLKRPSGGVINLDLLT